MSGTETGGHGNNNNGGIVLLRPDGTPMTKKEVIKMRRGMSLTL